MTSTFASWNSRAAATYLDARMAWWLKWPTASRDHGTSCVSCHTALPYALARPALRAELAERDLSDPERKLVENVVKRVWLWKDVDPFYPDQTTGLPKTRRVTRNGGDSKCAHPRAPRCGERNTERRHSPGSPHKPVVLAVQDEGHRKAPWAWLNFHNEPWEANGSPYFGAALGRHRRGDRTGQLRVRAGQSRSRGTPFATICNAVRTLCTCSIASWRSGRPGNFLDRLTPVQHQAITSTRSSPSSRKTAGGAHRRSDRGSAATARRSTQSAMVMPRAWSCSRFGERARHAADVRVRSGLEWLIRHQDASTGMWVAT